MVRAQNTTTAEPENEYEKYSNTLSKSAYCHPTTVWIPRSNNPKDIVGHREVAIHKFSVLRQQRVLDSIEKWAAKSTFLAELKIHLVFLHP